MTFARPRNLSIDWYGPNYTIISRESETVRNFYHSANDMGYEVDEYWLMGHNEISKTENETQPI